MQDKHRFVDQLLDSALAHHRAAEPRPGLEGRVLERVRGTAGEEVAGGRTWILWIAAAATVGVVTFVAIRVANRSHSPAMETSQAAKAVPTTSGKKILTANSGAIPKAGNPITAVEPKQIAHRESKPSCPVKDSSRQVEAHHWPSQFPTPTPLTTEQKALVQYVRETPPELLTAFLSSQPSLDQPVEIKPMKIAPLETAPLSVETPKEAIR